MATQRGLRSATEGAAPLSGTVPRGLRSATDTAAAKRPTPATKTSEPSAVPQSPDKQATRKRAGGMIVYLSPPERLALKRLANEQTGGNRSEFLRRLLRDAAGLPIIADD